MASVYRRPSHCTIRQPDEGKIQDELIERPSESMRGNGTRIQVGRNRWRKEKEIKWERKRDKKVKKDA